MRLADGGVEVAEVRQRGADGVAGVVVGVEEGFERGEVVQEPHVVWSVVEVCLEEEGVCGSLKGVSLTRVCEGVQFVLAQLGGDVFLLTHVGVQRANHRVHLAHP